MSPVRLQVTVMIAAFVVSTISSAAAYETVAPTTTTPPTTIPSACKRLDGSFVEGLVPGSSVKIDCTTYVCDTDGKVMELIDECGMLPMLCADSVPGPCCRVCPNGKGSKRGPNGTVTHLSTAS